ncbi:SGNH/GDSL hydrolase family protein [uncultured Lactobacillus sp.]|uniref:SGNH/GDSL hydrolase family protein n=1 Tax=uncultured Lactobacillus sp. TaxID=153152 RepID=UPI0026365F5E|nr:SGNH/GDSL hydrolase family protein [uncultured Lactobacillus sp.]
MTMTSVNNGEPYYLKVDISKAGESAVSINNYIKMRVFDNGKILPVKWFDQNVVMNVNGMIPFIEGSVGQFSTDDNDNIVMAPDAVHRDWQGTAANTRDGGWADYILTDQMFTEEGAFSGFIGLMDGNGRRLTSINIWFRVLGDNLFFGLTQKYYSDKIEKFIKQMQAKGDKAIDDLYQKYNTEVRLHEGALQESTQSLQLLSTQATSILSKLETNDVITIDKYNQDKQADRNQLQTALSKLNTSIEGFPTAEDLKNKYPSGKDGIFVTMDSGHGYIYWNGSWTDCGPLINVTDNGAIAYQPFLDKLPLKTHDVKDYLEGNNAWWAFNKVYKPGYVSYVSVEVPENTKAIIALVDKDSNKVIALNSLTGIGTLAIPFNMYIDKDFYVLLKANKFKYLPEDTGIDYAAWDIYDGDTGDNYVSVGQDMNPQWKHGSYTPKLTVAYVSLSEQLVNLYQNQFNAKNTSVYDFDKYLDKGGYFFGVEKDSGKQLEHAPNNDTYGYYSLVVLPINPSFYIQLATTYNAEHGRNVSLRYVGKKGDVINKDNPVLNQWLQLYPDKHIFTGQNDSRLDFDEYTKKGGYFFGVDENNPKLEHAPNNDRWGYYSLLVLPINESYFIQLAYSYNAEHGSNMSFRYLGVNGDGSIDKSNPPLNQWQTFSDGNVSHNKMFVAGDSITAGHPYESNTHLAYASEISRALKFNVTRGAQNGAGWLYNNGIDGMKIAENNDFKQYNVALFAFGTNDYGNNQPLGQLGDVYPEQKTFYGAVEYAIKKIYESNPSITLIISTPLIRVDKGDPSTKYALGIKNEAGYTLDQYIQAEIDICNKFGINYIDNRQCPINALSAPSLLVDRLHPTEEGYHVLGSYLTSKVASIIRPYVE